MTVDELTNFSLSGLFEKRMATLGSYFSLSAKKSHIGPVIETKTHIPENPLKNIVVRIEIKNTGDLTATIEGVKINSPYKILYAPKILKPGQESEILIETESQSHLKIGISYSSEEAGCLKTKDFLKEINLGYFETGEVKACSADQECPTGQTCCTGTCRPSAKGVCDDIDGDGEPDTWVEV
jgi:hypothetical protein